MTEISETCKNGRFPRKGAFQSFYVAAKYNFRTELKVKNYLSCRKLKTFTHRFIFLNDIQCTSVQHSWNLWNISHSFKGFNRLNSTQS